MSICAQPAVNFALEHGDVSEANFMPRPVLRLRRAFLEITHHLCEESADFHGRVTLSQVAIMLAESKSGQARLMPKSSLPACLTPSGSTEELCILNMRITIRPVNGALI